ncbi:MAG TPA: glycoside hydrolase family 3 N-terminal domain-containing protein, partial [Gemmatimonadales bacterium]|nr:glycoside hydrolase family 3 N-terminal domain-containing protein [Gemmatimonadales bacterium]
MSHSFMLLSMAVMLGCSSPPAPAPVPPHPVRITTDEREHRQADTVEVLLRNLTTRQKVAQLVMPWLLGDSVPDSDETMVRAYRWVENLEVGGIIISTGTPPHIAEKLNRLQRRAKLPLLVAADFEAGTTLRMAAGTPFPTQMGIAATGNTDYARAMGRITAIEGRAVGVHLAFAPVADVNSNPANPIINTRSFGGDPRDVARYVAATIEGMREGGILSTAKHFPGHGDTETDSHLALPTITAPWSRFDTLELVPFRAAVAAGVDAMMSAHIALPALDNGERRAGTLSPAVMTGILRDSLGFQGLIATDALDMGAIAKEIGSEEAVIRAFEAGSDLLLMPANPAAAITAVTAAVENGRIPVARLDASVRKVLEFKQRMGLFENRLADPGAVGSTVANPGFLATAREVTEHAVVLLKDSLGTVATLRGGKPHVALVAVSERRNLGRTLAAELRAAGWTVTLAEVGSEPSAEERSRV